MLTLTIPERTWAHPVPVGWKLLFLLGLTAVLYPVSDLWVLAGALVAVSLLAVTLGRGVVRRSLKMLVPLMAIVLLVLLYHVLVGRFVAGVGVVLKLLTLIGVANLVTMTSRLDDMFELIMSLLAPLKRLGVRPEVPALAFALVLRFVPVLVQKGRCVSDAWKCRSPRRMSWTVLIPLCLVALDDAERVADAIRARGGIRA